MKVYIYDNKEYPEIPEQYWPNTSPITEKFFLDHEGIIVEREDENPETEEPDRYSKLQVLLQFDTMENGEKYFINALTSLGLYDKWNAAQIISTDYPNIMQIWDLIWLNIREQLIAEIAENNYDLSQQEIEYQADLKIFQNKSRILELIQTNAKI